MADLAGRILMVANPGGHLEQLQLLDKRLPFEGRRLWVTADTPQTRSMLKDEDVVFVPDVGSRQYGAMLRNLPRALSVLRKHDIVAAVSTGSGLALPFLPLTAARGASTHYIESATRTEGPSLTGNLVARVPRLHVYTQHKVWADSTWDYPGSVFDGFEVDGASGNVPARDIRKIVVSLGTTRIYGFRRLVEKLIEVLPKEAEIFWQTGCTDVDGLNIEGRDQVSRAELHGAIDEADLLIAHAGTGIALTAFQAGHSPVLVPRELRYNEHVDEHQTLTADLLDGWGLAVVRRVDELDTEAIEIAAGRKVVRREGDVEPLKLHT